MITIPQAAAPAARRDSARVALFIDAEHFRSCAARGHEQLTGSSTRPSDVQLDGAELSRWFLDAIPELQIAGMSANRGRPARHLYDVMSTDRRRRRRQRRAHSVLQAEGFLVTTTRGPRRHGGKLQARLAADLLRVSIERQVDVVALLAGDGAYCEAVLQAQAWGATVILLVPPASSTLVAPQLRSAAGRAVTLHPEVFDTLFGVRRHDGRRGVRRACAG